MPVPVPVYSKQPAHPVIKSNNQAAVPLSNSSSLFQQLTNNLPLPPKGPPPSFASREEWINSLPDWRRNKDRRVWEDDTSQLYSDAPGLGFQTGLTIAENAMVIKGAPVQTCIPPVSTFLATADGQRSHSAVASYSMSDEDADDEMSPTDEVMGWQSDSENSPSDISDISDHNVRMAVERGSDGDGLAYASDYQNGMYSVRHASSREDTYNRQRILDRGVFSPLYEEISPELAVGNDPPSSPVGPTTPFGEYIDRAVADNHGSYAYENGRNAAEIQQTHYSYAAEYCNAQCYQCQHYQAIEPAAHPAPAPEPVVTPTATTAYRRLAEPISEWIANFVWKVCTTGMSLRPDYAQPSAFVMQYPALPPSHLAKSTHAMLLSTLLQPSAIFLGLWYIVRLPVFFGPACLGQEHVREMRFRAELLGEAHMALDREAIESYAPFRLIVLGCMLANKWLDDHTFSNKTWHTISNVPIRSLNNLESLALELFAHDLTIRTDEWSNWLSQLLNYHISLSSPAFPQPIGRPSTSPHTIVRKSIETVVEASVVRDDELVSAIPPVPVFVGLDDQQKDKCRYEQAYEEDVDVLEIDLDEDGPLREEYLPKRRISAAGNGRRVQSQERVVELDRMLPPPARWSPEADEPISRDQLRLHQQYVAAPQPIAQMPMQPLPPPAPFHQALELSRSIWPVEGYVQKHQSLGRNVFYPAAHFNAHCRQPSYSAYEYSYPAPVPQSHSRSQSYSYSQPAVGQSQGHSRSYSQTRFDGGYSDVRVSEPYYTLPPPPVNHWAQFDRPSYPHGYDSTEYYQQRASLKA